MPTTEELHLRLKKFEDFFTFLVSQDGDTYVMTQGGFHICTMYWGNQPRANGAVFSVASDVHKYAAYIAKDYNPSGNNVPGPTIYVENVRPGQQNIGIQIETANAAENIAIYANSQHSVGGSFPDRPNVIVLSDYTNRFVCIGTAGITLTGIEEWWITRAVGSIFSYAKKLWQAG